ncbi:hypothetical protein SAMN05446037_100747 [Anaerovirgula multivorans]|uniref:Uncharacterized protein n=1 Tax=Anaerovirgula multivorans TaxID=312168 RepID=A0A239D7M1_9FIRM|nr:hypothetical protein SAMN05446037_100747 [Anaerovirgula multivorans]
MEIINIGNRISNNYIIKLEKGCSGQKYLSSFLKG